MKLRIKGNTIRFRLTQTEIERVSNGYVEDKTEFPGGNSLVYKIEKGNSFNVQFLDGVILITVSSEQINDWASTDKISIENSMELKGSEILEISLEKDFKCLTDRPKEDESDMYPNPLKKHNC